MLKDPLTGFVIISVLQWLRWKIRYGKLYMQVWAPVLLCVPSIIEFEKLNQEMYNYANQLFNYFLHISLIYAVTSVPWHSLTVPCVFSTFELG